VNGDSEQDSDIVTPNICQDESSSGIAKRDGIMLSL